MKPWHWFALAAAALGALWFLLRDSSGAAANVPAASNAVPQTPVPGIGTVAGQFAKLASLGTNVVNIDAVPSTVAIGWLGQPAIVPTSSTPASTPDPTPAGWGSGGIQIGPAGKHLF